MRWTSTVVCISGVTSVVYVGGTVAYNPTHSDKFFKISELIFIIISKFKFLDF